MRKTMKSQYLFISIIVAFSLTGCRGRSDSGTSPASGQVANPESTAVKQSSSSLPVLEFEETSHDFGLMVQGERLPYKFKCTNTGGADAIISDVTSTCGCTIPSWTKQPIKPGEKGEVEVILNTGGKPAGFISKTVNVLANTEPNTIKLEVSAEIYIPDRRR